MFRKILNHLAVYSNGLLILLILLSFLGLISITSWSRRETLSNILQLTAILVQDTAELDEWLKVRGILGNARSGVAGRTLALAASEYDRALNQYARHDQVPEQSRIELRQNLESIILAYSELLRQRESAFDYLYSFLVIGIFMQSFALMVTLGRIGAARAEIVHQDTMLALVQKVREGERHDLASLLHDSILQDLGSLGLHPAVQNDPAARGILNDSIGKLRRITHGLAPLHLDLVGLPDSLQELITEHVRHGGIAVDFAESGYDDTLLDSGARLVLYRGIQEGLANIRKYASASRAELRLVVSHPYLILTLRDDGCGFNPKAVRKHSGTMSSGLGLALLARQAQGIGGELLVESAPGAGTKLQIRLQPGKGAK
ncbi:MAG: sensor histidine kinase [Clostridia bacterium]